MRVTDDAIRDAEAWITEQDRKLAKLPKCDYCGEPIQDDYYFDIMGDRVCESCVENMKRRTEYED